MLTIILIIAAAAVLYVTHTKFWRGIRAKDLEQKSAQVAVAGVEAAAAVTEAKETVEPVKQEAKEVKEVATPKQTRSTVAKSRARNKGKFQADDPATPENEAYKGGRKPRTKVKK